LTADEKLVLVTGANGFLGSHLTEALLTRGYRVRCMVRRTSDLSFIRDLPVEWVYADLQDSAELRQACQEVDAVCHCAALTRALDEETMYRVNTRAVEALAQACLEENQELERFLFVSSQAAAGPSRAAGDFMDESCEPRPITWYGRSKWAAEQALLALADRLPTTIIRPCPVFGPRDRDFFAYYDLVDLLLLALESDRARRQTYFGCGPALTYAMLSQAIATVLDKRTLQITLPEAILGPISLWSRVQGRIVGRPALLNDQRILDMRQRYWLCSGKKARRELGFEPRYDLETAVQETADWYQENGWL
jgi:dihydroflavonol-4-reductase